MNQVSLVGRIVKKPTIEINKKGEKRTTIIIAINRFFKNEEGMYETDFIPCVLYSKVAENTCEYCRRGDIIAVKGRLQIDENKLEVIGERVTFISSQRGVEE